MLSEAQHPLTASYMVLLKGVLSGSLKFFSVRLRRQQRGGECDKSSIVRRIVCRRAMSFKRELIIERVLRWRD
jgi:hypothetical protein